MSYDQAMKHWKNHKKDRYTQPCGGPIMSGGTYPHLTSEKQQNIARESMEKLLQNGKSHHFPIYVAQDSIGRWHLTAHNHFASVKVDSLEELQYFANEYVFA